MICSGSLIRAELYDKHTAPYTNVKAVYGANKGRHPGKLVVCNAHWYDPGPKPCGNYKVGGTVISKEWNSALGFGWSGAARPVMGWSDMSNVDNFVCTIPALVGGVRQDVSNQTAGVKRACLRTWWGFDGAGNCTVEVTTSNYTLAGIIDRMAALGIVDGLVLDGSGSSQCYDGQTHQKGDGRTIYSYLLLWFEDGGGETEDKKNMKVCLDPGHGGTDISNGSPDGTYKEHEFNLDLALRVKPLLERNGIEVVMTRDNNTSVDLAERAAIANAAGVDLYVSLHSNASGSAWSDASGLCVYTYASGATAQRNIAAQLLLTRMTEAGINIFSAGMYHAGFTVLANTNMPAYLVEYGFHTNKTEVELLKTPAYRDKLAAATAKAICDYFGVAWTEPEAPPPETESGAIYRVQVGAFKTRAYAEALEKQLKAEGYQTILKTE